MRRRNKMTRHVTPDQRHNYQQMSEAVRISAPAAAADRKEKILN